MFLKRLRDKLLTLFRSLGFREQLTLLLLAVLGTTLLLYSIVLYRNFLRVHETEFDTALYNYTVDVADALDINLYGEVVVSDEVFRANDKIFPFALDKTLLLLRTSSGKIVARSRELGDREIPLTPSMKEGAIANKVIFTSDSIVIGKKKANYRVATYFIDKPGKFDYIIQVASPMVLLERERRGLLAFFILSIPATLIIAGIGGYYFSSQATAPIDQIIRKAKALTARKLNERLPVPKVEDEIHELAKTLNDMLDRLQAAFLSQEAFVADASHQLKTPLAILRGELDMMKREKRSSQEIEEFFESASQEVAYLSRMVEELLLLARVESGGAGLQFSPTRLDELSMEVVSRMGKHHLLQEKKLRLQFNMHGGDSGDYTVEGDFDLIRTLMENLVDNAIKYSRSEGTVTVDLYDWNGQVEFRVTDQGEGFTSEEAQRIFNRFYRSATTGNVRVKGSGLGLSIVKKIADLHGARMDAHGTPGQGAQFAAFFPKKHEITKV